MLPTVDPKVHRYDLVWAIWSPRKFYLLQDGCTYYPWLWLRRESREVLSGSSRSKPTVWPLMGLRGGSEGQKPQALGKVFGVWPKSLLPS